MPPSFFDFFFCENATVDFYRGEQTKPSVKYETPLVLFVKNDETQLLHKNRDALCNYVHIWGILGESGTPDMYNERK